MKNIEIINAELNLINTYDARNGNNTIKIAIVMNINLGLDKDIFKFEVETTGGNCKVKLVSQWHSTDELQTYINLMNGELPLFNGAIAINEFADKIKAAYKVFESNPKYRAKARKAPAKRIAAKKK
tara:strand:- start:352 stop:729 length:378 start_codon:yes stop_codon:yes gene_type:complete